LVLFVLFTSLGIATSRHNALDRVALLAGAAEGEPTYRFMSITESDLYTLRFILVHQRPLQDFDIERVLSRI